MKRLLSDNRGSFVHYFELLPVIMLILSFAGRLPRTMRWQSLALFALIFVQYFTANIRGMLPWAAATHPVVALLLFWLSVKVAREAWRRPSAPRLASVGLRQ